MYRRLKNILGVSLVILAVLISQIPVPGVRAKTAKRAAEIQDEGTSVVTFNMNGGRFDGSYNGYDFRDKTPVLVIDNGETIDIFPDDKFATYSGYKTDTNTWYTDKECLTKYDTRHLVTDDVTLYKKWYNVTADGTTLAANGFHISADGTVLYRYDGEEVLVEIPQTVTVIAAGAFDQLAQDVRGITLPAGIHVIEQNAFCGVPDGSIVYIYDSGTAASIKYGRQLAAEYEQLVYSEYLDPEKTEEIAGIQYLSDEQQEDVQFLGSAGAESESSSDTKETEANNHTDIQENDINIKPAESMQPGTAISGSAGEANQTVNSTTTGKIVLEAGSESTPASEIKTTQSPTATSAGAPKSTQHIKDSTPDTGDPLQYRMLVVCAMFSGGVLLILTGNGKRKRSSAS